MAYQLGKINGNGSSVNMRVMPFLNAKPDTLVASLPDGTGVLILYPLAIHCDGRNWFLVDTGAVGPGFVAADFIVPSNPPQWSTPGQTRWY